MDFTYYNAIYTVENALSKVKDEKGMKRLERFLQEGTCPKCHGTPLCLKPPGRPACAVLVLDTALANDPCLS